MTQAGVDVEQPTVEARAGDADAGLAHDSAIALLAVAQRLDEAAALAHVARDGRGAHHLARLIAERRDGHRDFDPAPVLAHADGFVVVDALAARQASEDVL